MKRHLNGGIETIIAVVILIGLVILGIATSILPIMSETDNLAETAKSGISGIGDAMGYSKED